MMKGVCARSLLGMLAYMIAYVALAQATPDVLGVPGPLKFGEQRFTLAWSSHPSPQYYKHEYLPAGQTVERYGTMLMLDLVATPGASPMDVAKVMAESIKQRKSTDPVANYVLLQGANKDEVLLDFALSAADANGEIIVEWNGYRYLPNPAGDGTLLIAISRRAYGDASARSLLTQLKTTRERDIPLLEKMPVPALAPVRAN